MPNPQRLSNSPADVVRWMLVALGIGSDPTLNPLQAWPVYCAMEPSVPDNCITVIDTVGQKYDRSMPDGDLLGFDGFQVRVRATDHQIGWQMGDSIQDLMASTVYRTPVPVPAQSPQHYYSIHAIDRIGDVLCVGIDNPNTKRRIFTINALCYLLQES
jgi:hypothetical protein